MSTKPKFLVRCNCDEFYACGDEHVEFGMVAAHCDECDAPAVIEFAEGHFMCEGHLRPCWKCAGVGCRACGDSGSEATRRVLQNCAELPAFHVEEPTQAIPAETMAEAVLR